MMKIHFLIKWLLLCLWVNDVTLQTYSCKWGDSNYIYLTEKNLIKYGNARLTPTQIVYKPTTSIQNVGGLLYDGTLDLTEDFHLHLKLTIRGPLEYTSAIGCYNTSFGLILGKTNNIIAPSSSCAIGSTGISNVIAYQGYFNRLKAEYRNCLTTVCKCTTTATSKSFPAQFTWFHTPNVVYNWHLLYTAASNKIEFYEGSLSTTAIFSHTVNLLQAFGNKAYFSMTGYLNHMVAYEITNTFICTKYSLNVAPTAGLLYNGYVYTTLQTFVASSSFSLRLVYNSSYTALFVTETVTTTCGTIGTMVLNDALKTYPILNCVQAKNNHYVQMVSVYRTQKIEFNISNGVFKYLKFVGYDGQDNSSAAVYDSTQGGVRFKWGSVMNGNFKLSDTSATGLLKADFEPTDLYGNVITDLGSNFSATIGLTAKVDGITLSPTIVKLGSGRYQIQVPAKVSGKYILTSNYFTTNFTNMFLMYDWRPTDKSICKTPYGTTQTFLSNIPVTYTCSLYDNFGVILSPSNWKNYFGLDFSCQVERTFPQSETKDLSTTLLDSTFQCTYTTSINGRYTLHGFYTQGTTTYSISSTTNIFIVLPKPPTITSARLYSYFTSTWYENINSLPIFSYITTTSGAIAALEWFDLDNTSFTDTISYSQLNLSDFTGQVYSIHDSSFMQTKINFSFTMIKDKQYIWLSVSDTSVFRRSSFNYQVKFTYNGHNGYININIPLTRNGGYIVCNHDFSETATTFIKNSYETTAFTNPISGVYHTLGTVYLRTSDNYLYNEFLVNTDFTFEVTPQESSNSVTFTRHSTIDGVYTLAFLSQKANTYTIKIKHKQKYLTAVAPQIKIGAEETSSTFENNSSNSLSNSDSATNTYTLKDVLTADKYFTIYFNIIDQYGNTINAAFTTANNRLNIDRSYTVNSVQTTANIFNIIPDTANSRYYIVDVSNTAGQHKAVVYNKTTNKNITFNYRKIPSAISELTSIIQVTSAYQIKMEEASTLTVQMQDVYKNIVALHLSEAEIQINKIEVIAINTRTNNQFKYEYAGLDGIYAKYTLRNLDEQGLYIVKGYVDKKEISICHDCSFEVVYNIFDINVSELRSIGNKIVIMKENETLSIYSWLEKPIFKFTFNGKNGEPIDYVSPNTNIKLSLQQNGTTITTLSNEFSSFNTMMFTFSNIFPTATLEGKFTLSLSYNDNKVKEYPIIFIQSGNDYSSDAYDISKTFISTNLMKWTAGESKQSFVIEFRTADNKRSTQQLDLAKLDISLSDSNRGVEYTKQHGEDAGQIIVNISGTKATEYEDNLIVSIKYNNQKIETEVHLIIYPSDWDHLVISSSSFSDQPNKVLNGGSTQATVSVQLTPYDKYANVNKNIFTLFIKEELISLFKLTHSDVNGVVIASTSSNQSLKTIILSIQSKTIGDITLSSKYLNNVEYKLTITGGMISKESTGEIKGSTTVTAGNTVMYVVTPRDEFGNIVTTLTQTDLNNFKIVLTEPNSGESKTIFTPTLNANNQWEYSIPVTQTGVNYITPFYKDEECVTTNNVIKVVNTSIDFLKTKLSYNAKAYSANESIDVVKSSLPVFYLQLYDMLNNLYTPDVYPITINDNYFCQMKYNSYIMLYICDNSVASWNSWNDGYQYELTLTNESKQQIKYNLTLKGVSDSNTSSDSDINYDNIVFDKKEVEFVAGESGQVEIEIYNSKNKRINSFLNASAFSFVFSRHPAESSVTVLHGVQFSKYILMITSTKTSSAADNNEITIKINNNEIKTKIKVVVNPGPAVNAYFIDKDNNKKTSLPDAVADENYNLRLLVEDKYMNEVVPNSEDIGYTILTGGKTVSSSMSVNSDGTIGLVVQPIYAGSYTIDSMYFEKQYTFTSIPGEVSEENSYITYQDTATVTAGDNVKVYIVLKDKYDNLIDPTTVDKTKFEMYYKGINNSEYTYTQIPNKDIGTIDNVKALGYEAKITTAGEQWIKGTSNDNEIRCQKCVITIKPKAMDLTKSDLKKYDDATGEFITLNKYEIQDNTTGNWIIRVYPRDEFGNQIESVTNTNEFTANIANGSKTLPIQINTASNDKSNIEFTFTDPSSYNALDGGDYTITITGPSSQKLEKTVALKGDKTASSTIDEGKTYILDNDLTFNAGDSGYILLQLRSSDNIQSTVDVKSFNVQVKSCDTADATFTSTAQQSGNWLYVKITTNKSNTYPQLIECFLKMTIDYKDFDITSLPSLQVTPNPLESCSVAPEYLKSDTAITDTNADIDLKIKVIGYDKYQNIAIVSPSLIHLTLTNSGNEPLSFTTSNDIKTGYQVYSTHLTKMGSYVIDAGLNEAGDKLFNNKYTVYNSYGSLDSATTTLSIINSVITAGDKSSLLITPMDRYHNQITPSEVIGKFSVKINNVNVTDKSISGGTSILFTSVLTVKGINKWDLLLDNSSIDCYGCQTSVNPTVPSPEKTLVYSYDNTYKWGLTGGNNSVVHSSQEHPLTFALIFRDQYENIIDTIDTNTQVTNAKLSGNRMDILEFDAEISGDNSKYDITLNTNDAYAFNHLVQRDNYTFDLTISYKNQNSFSIKFIVNHSTNKNDEGYGNNIYKVENTTFDTTIAEFKVGVEFVLNLKWRTEEGLIYNDDIDLSNDISCINPPHDPNDFRCTIEKATNNYGDYNVKIWSEKITNDTPNNLSFKWKEAKTETFKVIGQIQINVLIGIPDPERTILNSPLPATVLVGDKLTISFKLFDLYGNAYFGKSDIFSKLHWFNNNVEIASRTITLSPQDTYIISFIPEYPPTSVNIQILYQDDDFKVNIFEDELKTTIKSTVSWQNTEIRGTKLDSMPAGEKLDLVVKLYDSKYICINDPELNVNISAVVTGPLELSDTTQRFNFEYEFKLKDDQSGSSCPLSYEIVVPDDKLYTMAGTYSIKVTSKEYGGNAIKQFNQEITADVVDISKFHGEFVEGTGLNVWSGSKIQIQVSAYDRFSNPISSIILDQMALKIKNNETQEELDKFGAEIETMEAVYGTVNYKITINIAGYYSVTFYYKSQEITFNNYNAPDYINIIPGNCATNYPDVKLTELETAKTSIPTKITVSCYDMYNNKITKGGDTFSAEISLTVFETEATTTVKSKAVDLGNGSYDISFTPPIDGNYTILILLGTEQYGDTIEQEITTFKCDSQSDKTFLCPNKEECVAESYHCIEPANDCPPATPFKCAVNSVETCVKSQTDCDCPEGYMRCDGYYMKICVPINAEYECPFSIPTSCKKYPNSPILCDDGICRANEEWTPNQVVCPIGYTLCPDLSCAKKITDCHVYSDCQSLSQIRCADQSCVSDQKYCPSLYSCNNLSKVVCPDGRCVDNDSECGRLMICGDETPFRCSNGGCALSAANCPKKVVCGHEMTLCIDNICRPTC